MKHLLYIFIFCFIPFLGFSQKASSGNSIDSILKKVQEVYNTNNSISLSVNYTLFKNEVSIHTEESFDGLIVKDRQNYYSKINNTEFIQLSDNYVKINHDEKAMLYAKGTSNSDSSSPLNISGFINFFKTADVTETSDLFVCELISKDITMLPYSKVVLHINKKDYSIKKQILYLIKPMSFANNDNEKEISNPRLEITFSELDSKKVIPNSLFNISNYVDVSKSDVKPSNKLETYQLINTTQN